MLYLRPRSASLGGGGSGSADGAILFLAAPLWDHRRWKNDEPPASPGASRDDEETKEGDIEALVAAEERGKQQARDDDVQEGWNRFVAEQSGELAEHM